jgi:bifunctional DNase/RNase
LLLLVTAGLSATSHASPPRAKKLELIEMQVRDVVPVEHTGSHAVMLVSRDGTLLPVFVDEDAAIAIAFRLASRETPLPLPQDLLDQLMLKLGGRLMEIRIDAAPPERGVPARPALHSSQLLIRQRGKVVRVGARASDSIAMALSSGARIFATRQLLTSAGITAEQLEQILRLPGVGGSGPPDPHESELPTRSGPIDL